MYVAYLNLLCIVNSPILYLNWFIYSSYKGESMNFIFIGLVLCVLKPFFFTSTMRFTEFVHCWLHVFWKWRPVEIFRSRESIQDIIIYEHMKFRWNRTMLNVCGIVVAILKMVTARNFSMSGINSGHHNLPSYEMSLKSDNVEFVRYCGGHFENGNR